MERKVGRIGILGVSLNTTNRRVNKLLKLVIFYFHISHILLPYYSGKDPSKDINLDRTVYVYNQPKKKKQAILLFYFFLVYDSFFFVRQSVVSCDYTCLLMVSHALGQG